MAGTKYIYDLTALQLSVIWRLRLNSVLRGRLWPSRIGTFARRLIGLCYIQI